MFTTWVLIVALAHGEGLALTTAYFTSRERCEAAAAEWNKVGQVYRRATAKATCHQQ